MSSFVYPIRESDGSFTHREPTVGHRYGGFDAVNGQAIPTGPIVEYIGDGLFEDEDGGEIDVDSYAFLAEQPEGAWS